MFVLGELWFLLAMLNEVFVTKFEVDLTIRKSDLNFLTRGSKVTNILNKLKLPKSLLFVVIVQKLAANS